MYLQNMGASEGENECAEKMMWDQVRKIDSLCVADCVDVALPGAVGEAEV